MPAILSPHQLQNGLDMDSAKIISMGDLGDLAETAANEIAAYLADNSGEPHKHVEVVETFMERVRDSLVAYAFVRPRSAGGQMFGTSGQMSSADAPQVLADIPEFQQILEKPVLEQDSKDLWLNRWAFCIEVQNAMMEDALHPGQARAFQL